MERVNCVFSSGSENWCWRAGNFRQDQKDGKQRLASPFQKNIKMKVI